MNVDNLVNLLDNFAKEKIYVSDTHLEIDLQNKNYSVYPQPTGDVIVMFKGRHTKSNLPLYVQYKLAQGQFSYFQYAVEVLKTTAALAAVINKDTHIANALDGMRFIQEVMPHLIAPVRTPDSPEKAPVQEDMLEEAVPETPPTSEEPKESSEEAVPAQEIQAANETVPESAANSEQAI